MQVLALDSELARNVIAIDIDRADGLGSDSPQYRAFYEYRLPSTAGRQQPARP
jgi:hypothetical protein